MVAWTGPKNRTGLSFSGLVRDPDILGMKFFLFWKFIPWDTQYHVAQILLEKMGPFRNFYSPKFGPKILKTMVLGMYEDELSKSKNFIPE